MKSDFIRDTFVFKNHFWVFYNKQPDKVQKKIDWVIGLVRTLKMVPKQYFKHLEDGIYEIRIQVGSNIYRIFCLLDEGNLVILMNAFQKKTQKTPRKEIERAKRIKKEYYDEKTIR